MQVGTNPGKIRDKTCPGRAASGGLWLESNAHFPRWVGFEQPQRNAGPSQEPQTILFLLGSVEPHPPPQIFCEVNR